MDSLKTMPRLLSRLFAGQYICRRVRSFPPRCIIQPQPGMPIRTLLPPRIHLSSGPTISGVSKFPLMRRTSMFVRLMLSAAAETSLARMSFLPRYSTTADVLPMPKSPTRKRELDPLAHRMELRSSRPVSFRSTEERNPSCPKATTRPPPSLEDATTGRSESPSLFPATTALAER
jgi:hypothetical protein